MIRKTLSPRTLGRFVAVVALAAGVGLLTEAAAALATAPARAGAAAPDKKKPKHKKATLNLGRSSFGMILVTADGRTLYAYGPDGTDTTGSKCTGGCAQAWPA